MNVSIKTSIMTLLSKKPERLQISVKVKRPKRFKAGAELGSAVNHVAIDVEENVCGESESLQIQLNIEHSFETEDSHCKN